MVPYDVDVPKLGYDYSIFSNAQGGTGDRVDPKPIPESLNWYTNTTRMNACKK